MPVDLNPFQLANILNLVLFALLIALIVVALIRLGRTPISDGLKVVWTLIILFVPFMGALAFLLVYSLKSRQSQPNST